MAKLILTTHEASEMLSVSPSTLKRLAQKGVITPVKISTRRVGWRVSDLIEFTESLSQ
jgi:excisionase family DNA binding protein